MSLSEWWSLKANTNSDNDRNIGIRDAKPPAYAKHSLSRIFVDWKKQVERNIFLTTSFLQRLSHNSFSQRLSHNVFLTTSFSQRISHSVFLKPLHNHPHNVVPKTSQYTRNLSVLYKYLKISQIRLSSIPRNFDNFWSIKLKPRRCTSAIYILPPCEVSEP